MAKLGGVTHQAKPTEKLESIRKNSIILEKLDLMVQLDSIWLDSTT